MPVENQIGFSNCTADKQDGLAKFFRMHIPMVRAVFKNAAANKNNHAFQKYIFVDTNAGDGANRHYGEGSPVIFLRAIIRAKMPFRAFFIEREKANVESLREIVRTMGVEDSVEVLEGDNRELFPAVVRKIQQEAGRKTTYGLIYKDPNGAPDLDLLKYASLHLPKIDLLVRMPTRVLKRKANAPQCSSYRLIDFVKTVEKQDWIIRDTFALDKHHDWTFLFGSNYKTGDWKKERFFALDSEKGQEILERLGQTKKERFELAQDHFAYRAEAKKRNGGMCEMCETAKATELHHLHYGPSHDPKKLIHICHDCHCKLEKKAI